MDTLAFQGHNLYSSLLGERRQDLGLLGDFCLFYPHLKFRTPYFLIHFYLLSPYQEPRIVLSAIYIQSLIGSLTL